MKKSLMKTIDRRIMTTKIKESRNFNANLETQKSYQEMQETLKIISDLKNIGLITPPQFNVALHGEVR
ncbi:MULTISPECIES: hypothetical protein [Acinetobacter calcoaceticus/baumannii complex]|uniref:hypothetical protein n=1 Tax=Acinetobacter calcoaceticus/baumannii complex TaxID=909768 RepID=UPI000449E9F7|nr:MULTISPECIES: hypothetical protein [Acinetobacter calcoaceticus/baumannii complex]EXH91372.1 hypothetical protein J606_0729 [Acinetobacter baumannii 318814]MBJ8434181.1 hypothetical protein [Acinetobacter pittii]MCG6626294.1 hypothetical protein [Acinetobacter baumannii]MCU4707679.1 hypothetical protein [Acinetobacter pittii]MDC4335540.1 hypothetical protein [Acinetobacter baumannii]